MQEGGKIVIAVSVTFAAGVVTGWLLNTYTRKVGTGLVWQTGSSISHL